MGKSTLPRELEPILREFGRTANIGSHTRRGDVCGSWLGDVRLARPGQEWPVGPHGPLEPVLQINVRDLPFVPPELSDLALITVFLGWNDDGFALASDEPFPANGQQWLLRAYQTLDGLEEIECPFRRRCASTPIRWSVLEGDMPCYEDGSHAYYLCEQAGFKFRDHFETANGLKVGGWPRLIQSEIFWARFNEHPANPEFRFQIDSDDKLKGMWFVHDGVCYFGRGERGHEHEWAHECQFY